MAADLVIVDRDPIGATADDIAQIKPLATMVRGAFVFGSAIQFRPAI
jgi:predicted amidohydrolase YtcJ